MTRARTTTSQRWGRAAVLLTAAVQLAAPVLLLATADRLYTRPQDQLEAVPDTYAFFIWNAICVLGMIWAVWQALPVSAGAPAASVDLRDRLAWPLAGVFAGFTAWMLAAGYPPAVPTVPVFAVMLALLLLALARVDAARAQLASWPRPVRLLLTVLLGLYAGWSSVAIWLNLGTVLNDSGAFPDGSGRVLLQAALLAAAIATVVIVTLRFCPGPAYTAATAWALVAVVVRTARTDSPSLAIAAAIGLLAVVAAAAVLFARQRRTAILPT